jgi:hypothetical protein
LIPCFCWVLSRLSLVLFIYLKVLLVYWVDHDWHFPSSLGFIKLPYEFYSFLTSHICDCFSSSTLWLILLRILCNAGLVDMNQFTTPLLLDMEGKYFTIKIKGWLCWMYEFVIVSYSLSLNFISPCFYGFYTVCWDLWFDTYVLTFVFMFAFFSYSFWYLFCSLVLAFSL